MVLPPPTPAEGEAPQAEWLREVQRWLHLGHKGVLVLIRDPQLAQLRPLARMLRSIEASFLVTSHAMKLTECPAGALVLLVIRPQDLGWLNLNRPILAQRSLRVVLWPTREVGDRLKFESPDLHDWISHFVVCPPGVPDFAVEGLRVGWNWWPGVTWRGPGLDLALGKFDTPVTVLRPDAEFQQLVTALSANRRAVIRWEGVDSLRSLWRVRWALAEARHEGFCVLDQPSVTTPGWFPVDSHQLPEQDPKVVIQCDVEQAIELELEPARISLSDEVSDVQVGLLLEPGPALRQRHESPQIEAWRRALVRAIWQEPDRMWSRAQLAVFASLERDRASWPGQLVWSIGQPEQPYATEHVLRAWTHGERLDYLAAVSATIVDDSELVARWSPYVSPDDFPIYGALVKSLDPKPDVHTWRLGRQLGWDAPRVIRAVAFAASNLIDHPEQLRRLIDEVRTAASVELSLRDRSLLRLELIGARALALAGDPWTARERIVDIATEWLEPFPFWADVAAIHVLCGEYSRAAQLLKISAEADSAEAELYGAALLASGQADRARVEHIVERLDAATVAREFLRKRLDELAR
jgi:hypothetical protein